jgi:signal transduction histidine kinase
VRPSRLALLLLVAGGLAAGAEWVSHEPGQDARLVVADGVVGLVLVGAAVVAWDRRPDSRVGSLTGLAGLAWFTGTLVPGLLFAHRGPLVHLHLSYPTGRLRSHAARITVVAAYLIAAIDPWARDDVTTLVVAGLVAAVAVGSFLTTSGTARRANATALAAALAFTAVLAFGAIQRLAGWEVDREALWAYDIAVAGVAVVLLADLLRGRWTDAVVTDLVVDLGTRADTGTLRDALARALGDPSLVLGYWLPDETRYVDDRGQHVDPTRHEPERVVTPIDHDGEPIALLIHDTAVLDDPNLVEAVAAAARLAVTNARLQAEARDRIADVAASRRRIVEAADAQRRRLAHDLRQGALHRLDEVAALLVATRRDTVDTDTDVDTDGMAAAVLDQIGDELSGTRTELDAFARGVHPRSLTEGGLTAALPALAERAGVPVRLTISENRLPPAVEAALYFCCSEALTNVAKYADATQVHLLVDRADGQVTATIEDDGIGGADPTQGSGLRGLADRVEALGGKLSVQSPPGAGTRLDATLPLDQPTLPLRGPTTR